MFLPVICSGRLGVRNMTWILESSLILLGFLLLVGPFGLDLRGHIVCTTSTFSPHSLYFCHLHFVVSCCDPFCFLFSSSHFVASFLVACLLFVHLWAVLVRSRPCVTVCVSVVHLVLFCLLAYGNA